MSHSLNSLRGGYTGDYIGDYYRVIKGDTRSLDYSTYAYTVKFGIYGWNTWNNSHPAAGGEHGWVSLQTCRMEFTHVYPCIHLHTYGLRVFPVFGYCA